MKLTLWRAVMICSLLFFSGLQAIMGQIALSSVPGSSVWATWSEANNPNGNHWMVYNGSSLNSSFNGEVVLLNISTHMGGSGSSNEQQYSLLSPQYMMLTNSCNITISYLLQTIELNVEVLVKQADGGSRSIGNLTSAMRQVSLTVNGSFIQLNFTITTDLNDLLFLINDVNFTNCFDSSFLITSSVAASSALVMMDSTLFVLPLSSSEQIMSVSDGMTLTRFSSMTTSQFNTLASSSVMLTSLTASVLFTSELILTTVNTPNPTSSSQLTLSTITTNSSVVSTGVTPIMSSLQQSTSSMQNHSMLDMSNLPTSILNSTSLSPSTISSVISRSTVTPLLTNSTTMSSSTSATTMVPTTILNSTSLPSFTIISSIISRTTVTPLLTNSTTMSSSTSATTMVPTTILNSTSLPSSTIISSVIFRTTVTPLLTSSSVVPTMSSSASVTTMSLSIAATNTAPVIGTSISTVVELSSSIVVSLTSALPTDTSIPSLPGTISTTVSTTVVMPASSNATADGSFFSTQVIIGVAAGGGTLLLFLLVLLVICCLCYRQHASKGNQQKYYISNNTGYDHKGHSSVFAQERYRHKSRSVESMGSPYHYELPFVQIETGPEVYEDTHFDDDTIDSEGEDIRRDLKGTPTSSRRGSYSTNEHNKMSSFYPQRNHQQQHWQEWSDYDSESSKDDTNSDTVYPNKKLLSELCGPELTPILSLGDYEDDENVVIANPYNTKMNYIPEDTSPKRSVRKNSLDLEALTTLETSREHSVGPQQTMPNYKRKQISQPSVGKNHKVLRKTKSELNLEDATKIVGVRRYPNSQKQSKSRIDLREATKLDQPDVARVSHHRKPHHSSSPRILDSSKLERLTSLDS